MSTVSLSLDQALKLAGRTESDIGVRIYAALCAAAILLHDSRVDDIGPDLASNIRDLADTIWDKLP
jgi:hypothetical protein